MNVIHADIVPHAMQRYNSAGDYREAGDCWFVRISKTKDWRHSYLVLIHELVEMALTHHNGIDWGVIDDFDMHGEGKDHPDPGTLESAPYHKEHMQATEIEQRFAEMLGVDWNEYNEALDALEYTT